MNNMTEEDELQKLNDKLNYGLSDKFVRSTNEERLDNILKSTKNILRKLEKNDKKTK